MLSLLQYCGFLNRGSDPTLALPGVYDPILVALSVLMASLATYATLGLAGRICAAGTATAKKSWLAAGAMTMGIGVWTTHFIGMLAFRLPMTVNDDIPTTLVSMLPAILASGIMLHVISQMQVHLRTLIIGGTCMGAGIGVMYYTGMAAAYFFPDGGVQTIGPGLEPTWLGAWLGLATVLITGLAIFVTIVASRLETAAHAARLSRSRLFEAIESISEGFSLYDADDRLVLCNSRYRDMMALETTPSLIDIPFTQIIRSVAEQGLIPEAKECTDAWVTERLAWHHSPHGSRIQQRSNGRWFQINEQKIKFDQSPPVI